MYPPGAVDTMVYAWVRRRRSVWRFYRYPSTGNNFSAILFKFGGYVSGHKSLPAWEHFWAHFEKTTWPPEPFLCRKMPFFRQLVLLTCKSNLSIIDILDRYMHLLYTCEHLSLFSEGVQGVSKYPIGAIML